MPKSCAGSWDAAPLSRLLLRLASEPALIPFGSMMWPAKGPKAPFPSAAPALGVSITAGTGRMRALCAQVKAASMSGSYGRWRPHHRAQHPRGMGDKERDPYGKALKWSWLFLMKIQHQQWYKRGIRQEVFLRFSIGRASFVTAESGLGSPVIPASSQ